MFSLCDLVQACGRRCRTAPKNCWRCGRDGGGNHPSHRCPDLSLWQSKFIFFTLKQTGAGRPPLYTLQPSSGCVSALPLWKKSTYQNSYSVKRGHRPGPTETCAAVFNSILLSSTRQRSQISLQFTFEPIFLYWHSPFISVFRLLIPSVISLKFYCYYRLKL